MENTELLQAMSKIMEQQLQPINNRLGNLEQQQAGIKQGQAALQQDMSEIKQRTTKVEVILENDIGKKLGLLLDGHRLNTGKL